MGYNSTLKKKENAQAIKQKDYNYVQQQYQILYRD